ncbi:MAG: tRNA (guanine(10)-N(2))-dimethyltransferase, partial [Candidatus Aenigmatarchaeota archaeon]
LTRDISVAVLQVFQKAHKDKLTICDALAGSGARGLRYAKEVKGIKEVILNDNNPVAVQLIKKNILLNKLGKICKASRCDANVLLSDMVFDVIDLDPFGPPVPFLDSAARSVMNKGALFITATDTSALAGSYPEACLRKYGVRSMKTDYYAELGMRILVSAIISTCAHHEKAFTPLLSFASSHYYRVFGSIKTSRSDTDKALGQFGFVSHCFSCGNRVIKAITRCELCGSNMRTAGPLWLGQLHDVNFCRSVMAELRKRAFRLERQEMRMLQLIEHESGPPLYYDIHEIAKLHKRPIPKQKIIIENLQKNGFAASRTHFCPTAIKTDASLHELLNNF